MEEVTEIDLDNPESTLITPTNSVVLFSSDVPRIDLRFPELGVHQPSEHPEKYPERQEG